MAAYDRSSKWLIEHYGGSLLRLGGVERVRSWRAMQPEVVQPAQLPDGLLEARLVGQRRSRLFVVEIGTYAERRVVRQILRGTLLIYLDRERLPEPLVVLLRPRGRLEVPDSILVPSEEGWGELRLRWRVVELWTLAAEDLLATEDPGLMPWTPLTRFTDPPRNIVARCREVIDRVSADAERANLLAVTQVLTRLRYNDPELLTILGGSKILIESPLLQEIEGRGEARGRIQAHIDDIVDFLNARFGQVPEDIHTRLSRIQDEATLKALVVNAGRCPDLATFSAQLSD